MARRARSLALVPLVLAIGIVAIASDRQWTRLAPLPDREGVAGACAGVSGNTLLVAGGANFPDGRPWDGGAKVWHDAVFALDRPDGAWRVAGRLSRPLGYAVSVTQGGGVLCAGGSDATRHYADVIRLDVRDGRLVTTPLPPLPITLANASGALVGTSLYVAGGQEHPSDRRTSRRAFVLDFAARVPAWRAIDPWPGPPRMLAVAASAGGAFWLIGGTDLVEAAGATPRRRYLKDAYRYDAANGWTRVADLPHPVVAAPSPAPSVDSGPVVLGGDDGTQVRVDPARHRGFSAHVLRFDAGAGTWRAGADLPFARVTTPFVEWGDRWIVPSGEARPGVRSPEVWSAPPVRGVK